MRFGCCGISFFQLYGYYFFFFFKQKTAYEMQRGLVGSEMCIRDRTWSDAGTPGADDITPIIVYLIVQAAPSKMLSILNYIEFFRDEYHSKIQEEEEYVYQAIKLATTFIPVSYTHLTLPTILLVQISVVAVSLKKKQKSNSNDRLTKNQSSTACHVEWKQTCYYIS
eukprot:TRINITY_DN29854_c0_g1_i1.p1 TRINITY_DN29854_c0_g1~~TRINITY_DN29854_c0_g1_i1.p1  ORF type:complete len:167 (+),score=45.43 TRINITY_DN29854_c0_g1_i1:76-576(+)